jgi:hypothetical protein
MAADSIHSNAAAQPQTRLSVLFEILKRIEQDLLPAFVPEPKE